VVTRVLVVVAGNAKHGKDTTADVLAELLPDARRDAYAAPLKVCVHLKTGIPMDVLNGPQSVKEDPKFGRYGQTPRKLMQDEGQEARDRIGETVWMDRLVERTRAAQERCTIVSDGRHPNEEIVGVRAALGSHGVVLGVRVVRQSVPVVRGHPSEDKIADAPDSLFDVIIRNDGTLEDLRAMVQQVADLAVLRAKTGGRKKAPEGWIVRCPSGGRSAEPLELEQTARVVAAQPMVPCPVCGTHDSHEVEPVSYDLIEIV